MFANGKGFIFLSLFVFQVRDQDEFFGSLGMSISFSENTIYFEILLVFPRETRSFDRSFVFVLMGKVSSRFPCNVIPYDDYIKEPRATVPVKANAITLLTLISYL